MTAAFLDHPLGRWPEGARNEFDFSAEEVLDELALAFVPHLKFTREFEVIGKGGNTVIVEKFFEKVGVFAGYASIEFRLIEPTLIAASKFARKKEVNAVRLVTDLFFNPVDFFLDIVH
jgi:hypothetical protein